MIKLMFYNGMFEKTVSNLVLFFINQKRKALKLGKKDDFVSFLSFTYTKKFVFVHENQIIHLF